MPPQKALECCFECRGQTLTTTFVFSSRGVPHGRSRHNVVYDYQVLSICARCHSGVIEIFSHDCFSHSEPWDMYWWISLLPPHAAALSAALSACPDKLRASCACEVHADKAILPAGLAAGLASHPGAEIAARAVFVREGERGRLEREPRVRIEMHPRPPRRSVPPSERVAPHETRHYLAGLRPIKRVVTADGGLFALKFDWETGLFECGPEYLRRIDYGDDIDPISEDELIELVETHRGKLPGHEGPLAERYAKIAAIERAAAAEGRALSEAEQAELRELRRESYAAFQALHPDPDGA